MLTINQLKPRVALRFTMEIDDADEGNLLDRARSDDRRTLSLGRAMSFVAFFAVVILVLGGLHYYVWARVVRDTRVPQPWAALSVAGLVLLAAGLPLVRLLARRMPAAARILSWPL
jgi:hypothetical protein